jgi:signal transduction histidine kinase
MTHEFTEERQDTVHANLSKESRYPIASEFNCPPQKLDDLVHELRQPLSTIECLTYYLELVCTDMETRSHLRRIQDMVTNANHILERASMHQAV